MEAPSAAAAAVRGGSLVRPRPTYGCARGPRRVVGGSLATPGRGRALIAVASLPEPVEPVLSLAQDGAMAHAPQADQEVHEANSAAAGAETSSPSGAPGKTVRVRFVLKKQCPFGQSFHLVGDDPALGLWDPEKAVALQWVEGHKWIVEKDLPANKLVEFKFLVRNASGKFLWQNGPNRSLRTGETVGTLVVYEDWDNVKNQKIEEEGEASVEMGDTAVSDDNGSTKDNVVEDELQMDENKEVEQDESIVPEDDAKAAFTANDSDQEESMKANKADPPKPFPHEELKGLTQLYEEKEKENENILRADECDAEKMAGGNMLFDDGAPIDNELTNAYEHDFLWGWKALQELLLSLGFKMDTS